MRIPFLRKKSTPAPVQSRVEPVLDPSENAPAGNAVRRSDRQRHAIYAQQRFAAANADRLKKGMGWGYGLSPDEVLRRDLNNIRVASRKAGEDVGYVKRYFGMVQTHVIGDAGVRLQSAMRTASGELDTKGNKAIEQAFKRWAKKGICEISGRLSLVSAEQLIAKTVSQDGDMIIRHIEGADNEFGYAFQLLEPDMLDTNLYKTLGNGRFIKMGVEVDGYGRHLAYHLFTHHPGDYTWTHNGQRYVRVPAHEIELPFPMWRPGQTRGVPWAHASLLDYHDINSYRESSLVSSRVAASNMLMYVRDTEQEPPEDDGLNDEGEFVHELEPGASSVVPQGYKVHETHFQNPGDNVADFQKAALKGASAGLDVSYPMVANDYEGVNFSSIRAGVLEDREHWKRMQSWFISQVMEPIFQRWLKNALLRGAVPGLRAFDLDRAKEGAIFRGRRWNWVDPLKDEQAIGEAFKNHTVNPLDVLNEKGIDLDEMGEGWQRYLEVMEPFIARHTALQQKAASAKPQNDSQEGE